MSSLKKQAISGVIWTFAQQFSVQLINFIVQIILARLLMPKDFGLIAMLIVFISIGQKLMDGGMTSSLIRTKNPDQLDYSTVFITNFIVSVGIYLIIFFIAPYVASFYNQIVLKDILRVYALSFVINSFVAVPIAKLTKEMNFKTQMKMQVPSTIIGALVGIIMAYMGYGVWSLVWLNIIQTLVFAIQNWLFIKWRPSLVFNKRRFRYHFNFGYKMTLSGLLDSVYNDAYRIVIGKFFSPASVGYFNQAETMRSFPVNQLATVMGKVTFPMFANIKDDKQLKSVYKKTMKLVFFIVVPMMLILVVTGKELFIFLFGDKWLPAVPYFQILAFASVVKPLTTYNLNILKVKGRSDLFLKLEVYKKIIGVIAIILAIPYGIMGLVISFTIVYYLMNFLNMIISGKLINYSIWEQIGDCYRIFFAGLICFVATVVIKDSSLISNFGNLPTLIAITLIFIGLYLSIIYVLDKDMLSILKNLKKGI